jgi:ATP-binding cassette subfamily B protein
LKELAYLNKYFLKYKFYLIAGILSVILSNIFAIVPAQMVRLTFNMVADTLGLFPLYKHTSLQDEVYSEFGKIILLYGTLIVLMALIRGVFLFLMRQTTIVMSRKIEFDLKNEIYAHYQALPLSFYRKNNTGDLMARISEDVGNVRMYLGPAVMYGVNLFITSVLVIGYMLSVNALLTFYVLLPLPLLSISIYYVNNLINKRSEAIQKSLSGISTFVQESFSGIRVIKAYAREDDIAQKFNKESTDYRDKSLQLTTVNALFYPLMLALIGLSTVLTIYVGGIEVINGTITPGNIAEFIIYVNLLTWPVTALGWVISITKRAEVSQRRINEFLKVPIDIVSTQHRKDPVEGEITFQDVSFVYPDSGVKALKHISLTVRAGESVAILGSTGSGKSTLANLICRLYDPTSGRILIDGHDIKSFDIPYLRQCIGYVPQDVFLFSDTVGNNIAFGPEEKSMEEIERAAVDADLLENIRRFPNGFETMVGERGITLSGGQKQRVSIARAIIKKPKILLLDDCLSAVDTKTENAILNSLKTIMANRTSIIISHRVSSAKLADRIAVLEDGELIEVGTHEELMALEGAYKSLYERQLNTEEEVSPS